MTIREGSRGHTDPAGKNWSKWFGGEPPVEPKRPQPAPQPVPAELDPEDGA